MIVNAAAESHVEKSIEEGGSRVRDHERRGDAGPPRRDSPRRRSSASSSSPRARCTGRPRALRWTRSIRSTRASPYAATKAGADRLAYSYYVTYGLPIVIVRPFNNYGPYQHPEKVIPRFITQALRDEPLTVHGDGHASRDWVFVDDVAEAIEAAIAADLDDGARRGDQPRDRHRHLGRREIADLVLERLGKPASLKVHTPERPGQVDRHIGSTEKAERLLGWRARTSFEDGLERTIAWYQRQSGVVGSTAPAEQTAAKRLLVLGAGPAQLGLLRAARDRGLFVIACDRDPAALGFEYADRRAVVSTRTSPPSASSPRRSRWTGSSRPGSTGRSRSRRASPRRSGSRTRSTPRSPRSPSQAPPARAARRARRAAAALGADDRRGRRPAAPRASSSRPTARGRRGSPLVRDRAGLEAGDRSARVRPRARASRSSRSSSRARR